MVSRGSDPVKFQMRKTSGIAQRSFLACINDFPSPGTKKNIYMNSVFMVRMGWDSSTGA